MVAVAERQAGAGFTTRLAGLVTSDPQVMGGAWVFRGTRVPVDSLFDNLADGLSLDEILRQFPTLDRADCAAVLERVGGELGDRGSSAT